MNRVSTNENTKNDLTKTIANHLAMLNRTETQSLPTKQTITPTTQNIHQSSYNHKVVVRIPSMRFSDTDLSFAKRLKSFITDFEEYWNIEKLEENAEK
jgi:hypothetical protein